VLYKFPGVKEAAVIGIPTRAKASSHWHSLPATKNSIGREEFAGAFAGAIGEYKVPRKVIFMAALRTTPCKILKTELRKMAKTAA